MDRRAYLNNPAVAVRAAIDQDRSTVWTAMPAILQSYNAVKQTCTAQPAIQGMLQAQDGTWSNVDLPLLQDCPVLFPSGGGFTITFPLAIGDEGLVIFASRCIDAWWQGGGHANPQVDIRMHDLSDGFFLPGIRSVPRKLANVNATDCQLRSDDGLSFISIGPTKVSLVKGADSLVVDSSTHRVTVTAVGGLWVNGVQVTVP